MVIVDLEYNYDEATSAMDKFSQKDVEELRSWIQTLDKSKFVPKDLSNKQLVLFYNACYGDQDKTKRCIEKYYVCRKNSPEIFNDRNLRNKDLIKASELFNMCVLPGKSCDGYDVIYHKLHDADTSNFSFEAMMKLLIMTTDLCMSARGPQSGIVFLFDMKGSKLGHLTKMSLSSIRPLLAYFQEAIPVRMQAIHILNTEPIVDKLLTLVKPFMDKKFLSMIKFHNKNEDLAKLYEIVPKSGLPSDNGGDLPDSLTLSKQNIEKLQALEAYFKAEEEQRMTALQDPNVDKTLESSFKKLDID